MIIRLLDKWQIALCLMLLDHLVKHRLIVNRLYLDHLVKHRLIVNRLYLVNRLPFVTIQKLLWETPHEIYCLHIYIKPLLGLVLMLKI